VCNFFAQGGDATRGTVAIAARSNGIPDGVNNGRGGMKIRFAQFEMNDGTTLALKFFGARKNGEGAFAVKLCNTACDASHARKFSTACAQP
jgi:hypothetical protein